MPTPGLAQRAGALVGVTQYTLALTDEFLLLMILLVTELPRPHTVTAKDLSDAKAAGISRVFVLMTEDGPTPCPSDVAALEAQLKEGGARRPGVLCDSFRS